jgi:SAM-dependent methyltransferase
MMQTRPSPRLGPFGSAPSDDGGTASTGAPTSSVFVSPDAVTRRHLYGTPARLHRRTHALHTAKVAGSDAARTLADLAARVTPPGARVADIGCGRGTSSMHLAARLCPAELLLVDRSSALLDTAVARVLDTDDAPPVTAICADFHQLPLRRASLDLAVAGFCLYHSAAPEQVVAQIAATLATTERSRPGHAVLATKSTTSYVELDELVALTGLDPDAVRRPSLYATFHSTNFERITRSALDVLEVLHEQHAFRFTSHRQIAAYLATTPKYRLPEQLAGDPDALAAELARRGARPELTMTSTVSYVLARARP